MLTFASMMKIAVLLPCYNEALSVGETIKGFKMALPDSQVYVCDNNSSDNTAEIATQHGATVIVERYKGKGNAVRRLFDEVEADIYLLSDGDTTYDPSVAQQLIDLLVSQRLDMVVGLRVEAGDGVIYRPGHRFGNQLFNRFLKLLFKSQFEDIFSGYRVFSRRFVKSFPAESDGFEIETELAVHALSLRLPTAEVATRYFARPDGSVSKLNKFRDGRRILSKMIRLFIEYRPLAFFGIVVTLLSSVGFAFFLSVLIEFLETGLVLRLPTLVTASGLLSCSVVSMVLGLILHYQNKARWEQKRLCLLSYRKF